MILCDMNLELYDIAESLNVFYQETKEATHCGSPEFALVQTTTAQARPFL